MMTARESGANPAIVHLGQGVYAIDTQMGGYTGITASYLITGERPCLVETGTAYSAPVIREALASLGVGPHDLATIVVTHVHLDHAGGVGDVAESFPTAEVVVHERGARHLVDPERLMRSARRVFGTLLDEVFGPLRPVDSARVRALAETDSIDLGGGRILRGYYSPGHAQHHVALLDEATGDLYVGDAAGVYVPETRDVRPATPPPDFDLESACASLQRFRELQPTRLLFSHFGPVRDTLSTLDRAEEELRLWVELAREARAHHLELEHAVAMVQERTKQRYAAWSASPDVQRKFERLNSTAANLAGINRWLDQLEAQEAQS